MIINGLISNPCKIGLNSHFDCFKIDPIHRDLMILSSLPAFGVVTIQPIKRNGIKHIALRPRYSCIWLIWFVIFRKPNMPWFDNARCSCRDGDNSTQSIIMPIARRYHYYRANLDHFGRNEALAKITSKNMTLLWIKMFWQRHSTYPTGKEKPLHNESGLIQRPNSLAYRLSGRLIQPCGNQISTDASTGHVFIMREMYDKSQGKRYATIDNNHKQQQYAGVAAHSATSFSRLIQRGRQAALCSLLSGIFMSAIHAIGTSFYGGQWQGGYVPAGTLCQSANPAICPPPQSFSSDSRAFKTKEKEAIMATIRKAFSRPIIAHPLRTFPTLIQAAAFVDRITASNDSQYRFNIIQNGNRWTVSRVIGGAA